MIEKHREKREKIEIFSIEGFVPTDHLIRKIDSAVDFTHIYDIVEDLYCLENGRPSIDPVVIFKMVLIQHLYGIPSLRRTVEKINEDRDEHNKKLFDEIKPPKDKEITQLTTDSESGVFHKGEHKKCFAYTAQTGCDKNGYVMDVTVNSGNVHDSVVFDGLYGRLAEKNPEIQTIVADAGYKTPWISKKVLDDGRIPVLPYKRPMSKKDFFKPYEYVYDKYYDCVICSENQVLSYATTNLEGNREFKSKGKASNAIYANRGLTQVTNWVRLKFAAMNLKKYAIHRWNMTNPPAFADIITIFFISSKKLTLNPF